MGVRKRIVVALLRRSDLSRNIHILTLNVNMRLNSTNHTNADYAKKFIEVIFLHAKFLYDTLIYHLIGLNKMIFLFRLGPIQKNSYSFHQQYTSVRIYPDLNVVSTVT